MLAGAPNLHRAVAECTQPYCAPPASATRTLQVRPRRPGELCRRVPPTVPRPRDGAPAPSAPAPAAPPAEVRVRCALRGPGVPRGAVAGGCAAHQVRAAATRCAAQQRPAAGAPPARRPSSALAGGTCFQPNLWPRRPQSQGRRALLAPPPPQRGRRREVRVPAQGQPQPAHAVAGRAAGGAGQRAAAGDGGLAQLRWGRRYHAVGGGRLPSRRPQRARPACTPRPLQLARTAIATPFQTTPCLIQMSPRAFCSCRHARPASSAGQRPRSRQRRRTTTARPGRRPPPPKPGASAAPRWRTATRARAPLGAGLWPALGPGRRSWRRTRS